MKIEMSVNASISFLIIVATFLILALTKVDSSAPVTEESSSPSRRLISDILLNQDKESAETGHNETGGEREKELEEDEEAHAVCGLPLYRLPRRIKPINYDLIVHPDLNALKFEGSVKISVRVGRLKRQKSSREASKNNDDDDNDQTAKAVDANKIVLHAHKYLKVDDIWYKELAIVKRSAAAAPVTTRANSGQSAGNTSHETDEAMGNLIEVVNVCRDAHYQLIVVTLARDLQDKSRGLLHLSFSGVLSASLRGLYKSKSLKTTNSTTKNYHAVTQLQAVEARRLFPCFDEPAFKATFDVSIIHQSDKLALSNMAPVSKSSISGGGAGQEGESNGTSLVKFARTPPMSTYLLALFVGELDFVEHFMETRKERRRLQVRVYTPIGLNKLGQFALEVVRRAIPLLERYFDNDLPLEKLDLIPLGDFESGAMENWGLITFKESSLLVDEQEDSLGQKVYVACTIVHELAHQWFGNLVTMKWWNEVWLNEGMATWLEFDLMEELFPDFQLSDYFLIKSHIYGLSLDSYRWSHPVELDEEQVEGPDDIDTLFDAISYNKASSIVHQMSNQFGSESFRRAVQYYINKHKYQNTNLDNLLEALVETGAPKELNAFLLNWISEPGHPLINVSLIASANTSSSNDILHIKQERFLTNVTSLDEEELEQRWIVPITVLVRGFDKEFNERQALVRARMDLASEMEIKLPGWYDHKLDGSWIKLNANFTGFYRVAYSKELSRSLHRAILADELTWPADRINVLDDAHSLMLAKRISVSELLKLIEFYSHETNGAVLERLADIFKYLLSLYKPSKELHKKLVLFGRRFFGDCIYQRVYLFKELRGKQQMMIKPAEVVFGANETYHEQTGREVILELLSIDLDYRQVVVNLLSLFDAFTRGNNGQVNRRPPVGLRSPVYKTVVAHGSEEQLARLLTLHKETKRWHSDEMQRILAALTPEPIELGLEAQDRFEFLIGSSNLEIEQPIC